jgi:DNA-binding CsgD family transcriptional regulator
VVTVEPTAQRPLERRVLSWLESGHDPREVAARFRRSPEFIDRVSVLARLPREAMTRGRSGLRPLERRVLRWREDGASFDEIAARFRRSPEFIERVVDMARLGPRNGG